MVVQMNNFLLSIKGKWRHSLLVSLSKVIFEVNSRHRVVLRSPLPWPEPLYTVLYVHVIGSAMVSWPLKTKTRQRHLMAVFSLVALRGKLLQHGRIKTFNIQVKVEKAALQQGKVQRLNSTLHTYVAYDGYVQVNIKKKNVIGLKCVEYKRCLFG